MTQRSWTRSFLDSQAALLHGPQASAVLRLLGTMGRPGAGPTEAGAEVPSGDGSVGIWKPTRDANGVTTFTRASEAAGQWGFWANVHRIAPKQQRRRVVLLGESAARGFLYDPSFNVAKALQAMLDEVLGPGGIEVVDLARLGLSPAGLLAMIEAAPALDPDVVVVYAGNNWRNGPGVELSRARRAARVGALQEGGLAALKQQCEDELADDVRAMLQRLSATWGPSKVPVVVVVPEVNLADWRDLDVTPGWLGTGRTAAWWSVYRRVMKAFGAGERSAAGPLIAELKELDQGTCARSHLLWADYQVAVGRAGAEVRRTLEQARDASIWNPRVLPSRTLRVMQDTLRTESARLGLHVVDLPGELERQLDTGVSDRRWFLDNCHLSHEGIRVVAAATAATIAPLLGGKRASAAELLRSTPCAISAATEAAAHFAAAIINAHWGQNDEVLRFHCERALARSPAISLAIEDYLELAVRRAPGWMCAALDRLASQRDRLALASMVIGNLAAQPKLMDRDLLDAMAGILGPEVERRLADLRCAEYGGGGVPTPLHQPYFALRTMGEREADSLTRPIPGWSDALRAYAPESTFALVEDRPRAVQLTLCARLAPDQPEGQLAVDVNGAEALRATVGSSWRTWKVTVSAEAVRRGVNQITVRWPSSITESGHLARAIDQLERGIKPELFPVFGEVHSFRATSLEAAGHRKGPSRV